MAIIFSSVIIPIILNVFMYIILNRYNKLNKAEIKEKNDDNNNDITINNIILYPLQKTNYK